MGFVHVAQSSQLRRAQSSQELKQLRLTMRDASISRSPERTDDGQSTASPFALLTADAGVCPRLYDRGSLQLPALHLELR